MLKLITKITLAFVCAAAVSVIAASASVYYVDCTSGSDTNIGSADKPFATIQKAASVVAAGDTVTVNEGVYYGPVTIGKKGTASKPITFKANGEAVITNADRTIREGGVWTLEDESLGLYSTPLTLDGGNSAQSSLFPTRVLSDGVDLLQYTSLENLKNFVTTDDETYYLSGYKHGYFYDGERLYIRLRADGKYGSQNPNDHIIKVSPSYYTEVSGGKSTYGVAVGNGSANIIVGDINSSFEGSLPSYNVVIDGFTLETPGLAGVYVRASDVTVKNCKFLGCRVGVAGGARYDTDPVSSDRITVSGCDYTQYPTYDDAEEFIIDKASGNVRVGSGVKYWWWHKKSPGTYGIPLYLRYEIGGLVGRMGDGWTICGNYVYNVFEGMSCYANETYKSVKTFSGGTSASVITSASNVKIYGNTFEKCVDNAIEFEEHLNGADVYENTFKNNFLPISWQPTKGTPWPDNIRFHNNIIHNTKDFNLIWFRLTRQPCRAFKIGATTESWNYPWMDKSELSAARTLVSPQEDGFEVYNNTIVMPYGYIAVFSISDSSGTGFNPIFGNIWFRNNIAVAHTKNSSDGDGESLIEDGNVIRNGMGIRYSGNVYAPDAASENYSGGDFMKGGYVVKSSDEIGFTLYTRLRGDFRLRQSSDFCGKGYEYD